jgi:hypothetical protein
MRFDAIVQHLEGWVLGARERPSFCVTDGGQWRKALAFDAGKGGTPVFTFGYPFLGVLARIFFGVSFSVKRAPVRE